MLKDVEQSLKDEYNRAEERGNKTGHKDCARITLNGRTISHTRTVMGSNIGYFFNLECKFFHHLRHALTSPDTFNFDGWNADRWLDHHAKRLGIKEWSGDFALWEKDGTSPVETFTVWKG
jgi:hypothetical protein